VRIQGGRRIPGSGSCRQQGRTRTHSDVREPVDGRSLKYDAPCRWLFVLRALIEIVYRFASIPLILPCYLENRFIRTSCHAGDIKNPAFYRVTNLSPCVQRAFANIFQLCECLLPHLLSAHRQSRAASPLYSRRVPCKSGVLSSSPVTAFFTLNAVLANHICVSGFSHRLVVLAAG
jgi:hypothetical protein